MWKCDVSRAGEILREGEEPSEADFDFDSVGVVVGGVKVFVVRSLWSCHKVYPPFDLDNGVSIDG